MCWQSQCCRKPQRGACGEDLGLNFQHEGSEQHMMLVHVLCMCLLLFSWKSPKKKRNHLEGIFILSSRVEFVMGLRASFFPLFCYCILIMHSRGICCHIFVHAYNNIIWSISFPGTSLSLSSSLSLVPFLCSAGLPSIFYEIPPTFSQLLGDIQK